MRAEKDTGIRSFFVEYGNDGGEIIGISEELIGKSENVEAALRYYAPAPYKYDFDFVELLNMETS